ncbi:CBO0543 family protein [Alicyclobacillus suci]|uniref:CBO0543 family protein n=1 Tax=Alicyclobacillus suci TaxID=2816080 RepID=UPI0034DD4D57
MALIVISIIILNVTALFMHKRIHWWELYSSAWFALFFELFANTYIDLKYDLYGFFDKGPSWQTILMMFGLYPAGNAIILNFYPYRKPWVYKILYIIGIDIICTLYEQAAIHFGVMYYHGWKWWYSGLAYLIIVPILVWNRRISRKLVHKAYMD